MVVKVFSTLTCPWCKKVKEFLKENKVKFKNIDVTTNQAKGKEMIELSGQTGVPVTDVNGTIIVGFDEAKLRKALKLK